MDPVSAIALSCNVFDLVDRAKKCGQTIKELYDSSTGYKTDHEDLDTITRSLETIVNNLKDVHSQVANAAADGQMQQAAAKCEALSSKMHLVLDKCKAKKKGSIRSASSATLRALLK